MDVAELRAQQFSTVTKLRGRVFAHVGGGFRGGEITIAEGADDFNAPRQRELNQVISGSGSRCPWHPIPKRTVDRDPDAQSEQSRPG